MTSTTPPPQPLGSFDEARKGLGAMLTHDYHPHSRNPAAFLSELDAAMKAAGVTRLDDTDHTPVIARHHREPQIILGLMERGASLERALDFSRKEELRTATDYGSRLPDLENFAYFRNSGVALNTTDLFLARIDYNAAIQRAVAKGESEDSIIALIGDKPVMMLSFYTLAETFDDAGLAKAKQALIDRLDPTITDKLRADVLARKEFPSVPDDDPVGNYGLRVRAVA